MRPLEKVYWLRLGLGIVAALLCAAYGLAVPGTIVSTGFTFTTFMNSTSIAILTYIVSYYLIKNRFLTLVVKPMKLFTTGFGVYFLSWIVFWVLLYTIIAGPT
jgi:hypothetical protein